MTIAPTDIVAYDYWKASLCRDCLADVLGCPPGHIEATLDRLSADKGVDRRDILHAGTINQYTFPSPVSRSDVDKWPSDKCTTCGQLLRTAPAIVRPAEADVANVQLTAPLTVTTF